VDYESKEDCAMTIRDRDTHDQVRVKIGSLTEVIQKLISGKSDFEDFK
jgi:glycyl-tRNA synthetase (class II)